MPPRLGILAGSGPLPGLLLEAGRAQGRDPFIVAFEGFADDPRLFQAPHARVNLTQVGKLFEALRGAGCAEIVLCGRLARPAWREIRPDWKGLTLLPKLVAAQGGDDALLRVIVAEFEAEGFGVLGADQILAELAAPAGALGTRQPDDQAKADIARAVALLRGLGRFDVGQGAIVQQGRVLGIEAAEGTDGLIRRCGALRQPGPGGVLVKLRKPGQERRVDLPTIGVDTVREAAAAGLAGIAVEAGGALVVDRPGVARAADESGLFVIGIAAESDG
ncbi:MAG: DUF1009 domain-containing protein [Alphaproteobacteria bacterium]|nr:DUF1009 domain-containing protein [Alphaproteobacteria bacterium]